MITMTDIIRDGHPTLRKVATEVSMPPTEEEKALLKSMMEYLINSQDPELAEKYGLRGGVGLAAPQINISKRMIAVHVKDENGQQYSYALFNPKIISHSIEKAYLTTGEGCLSVDETIPGYVPRYARITLKGIDLDGKEVKLRLKGLPAIVFQHEIDHLNGVMFYDHINENEPFLPIDNAIPVER
ncbi:peptide deformylase [Cytobacillus oceanisediminis]|uniref:Peptide deformylase n=2 Tax=Niallia TaxID=2837506 RepID=A0A941JMT0_NIACI|nr:MULTISPECIES: peptide deformylase [Bacillaceae]EOR26844.1 peptide deformylase [Niallia nealsonii AAU1]MDU1845309.1 peptide deformylase [Niallia nealsonii]MBZ9533418.1 peptide deformylase [Cytobacillus oceanisediminis]MCB5237628.1 peptide deformylase [Niallia circulans]MED3795565.1 peptide deformylase [Niallia alba]